jgi:hypothetical protein
MKALVSLVLLLRGENRCGLMDRIGYRVNDTVGKTAFSLPPCRQQDGEEV